MRRFQRSVYSFRIRCPLLHTIHLLTKHVANARQRKAVASTSLLGHGSKLLPQIVLGCFRLSRFDLANQKLRNVRTLTPSMTSGQASAPLLTLRGSAITSFVLR